MPLLTFPIRAPVGVQLFPVITTTSLPDATVGTAYGLQLFASFGAPPYTWSIVSASPNSGNWLSLSSGGLLTGTPGTAELELLTIQVSDSNGRVGASPFRLLVVSGGGGSGLTHGQLVTITGSSYGAKSRGLGPLLDDHGQGAIGVKDAQWTGGANGASSNPTYIPFNMVNQLLPFSPTGAAIGSPHPFVGSILAGCHYSDNFPWDVYVSRQLTLPTLPCVLYARWYERMDPNTVFGLHAGTNNNKLGSYGPSPGVPGNALIWHFAVPGPSNNTDATHQVQIDENTTSSAVLENPDRNGHNLFWNQCKNPFNASNGWILKELEICIDRTTGGGGVGYLKYSANGAVMINHASRTDGVTAAWAGATRYLSLGNGLYFEGYGDVHNWSYGPADCRIDMTGGSVSGAVAKVLWGDQPTLAASTIRSYMNITAWGSTSISGTFWKDRFTTGQTAYAHVVTESGTVLDNQASGVVA